MKSKLCIVLVALVLVNMTLIGHSVEIGLVVKNLGNPFFEAVHRGAKEAAAELGATIIFDAPAMPTVEGQIEIIDVMIARGVDVIAVAANDPEGLVPAGKRAMAAGIKMVTFDAPIAAAGRQIFINQADMELIGRMQVQMLAEMIGYEGEIAILSAVAGMGNQEIWIDWMREELKEPQYERMELVAIVYGDDLREKSLIEARGLFGRFPNLRGIISPTTVGIAATARALEDAGLSGEIALTGLGLPSEMADYIRRGTVLEMALWNPVDLGYLAAYVSYLMATGEITGAVGETFTAGRMGEYTVVDDGMGGTMVVLGPPFRFNAENIDEWADVY